MLVLDTSAVVAILDVGDSKHRAVSATLKRDLGPYIIPTGILSEIAYLVECRARPKALNNLLVSLGSSATQLDCGDGDIPRIVELCDRYGDLPLGYADAAVIACAERLDLPVLTCDDRHFDIVAKEGKLKRAI